MENGNPNNVSNHVEQTNQNQNTLESQTVVEGNPIYIDNNVFKPSKGYRLLYTIFITAGLLIVLCGVLYAYTQYNFTKSFKKDYTVNSIDFIEAVNDNNEGVNAYLEVNNSNKQFAYYEDIDEAFYFTKKDDKYYIIYIDSDMAKTISKLNDDEYYKLYGCVSKTDSEIKNMAIEFYNGYYKENITYDDFEDNFTPYYLNTIDEDYTYVDKKTSCIIVIIGGLLLLIGLEMKASSDKKIKNSMK